MKPELITVKVQSILVDHMATGARMRQARKEAGIKLATVAEAMKVSSPFLSELERGRRNWTPLLAMKFKDAIKNGKAK
jgi:transcriptional regulator with XRE-family HTH domain